MTTPIPDLPETPLPSQNRPDFEETVETFLLSLQPWADAANVLGGEMDALASGTSGDAALANFAVPFPEWQNFSSRSLATATGMVDGTPATVSADDTGTHTEHVSFGGDDVPNAGRYVYFTSVSTWQRIGPLDSTLSAASATAAEGFKDLAEAARDEVRDAYSSNVGYGRPAGTTLTTGSTITGAATFAFVDPVGAPWVCTSVDIWNRDTRTRGLTVKKFDASGAQIGSNISLTIPAGAASVNVPIAVDFSGDGTERLGFYIGATCGVFVTSGVGDEGGYQTVSGSNASSVPSGNPIGTNLIQIRFNLVKQVVTGDGFLEQRVDIDAASAAAEGVYTYPATAGRSSDPVAGASSNTAGFTTYYARARRAKGRVTGYKVYGGSSGGVVRLRVGMLSGSAITTVVEQSVTVAAGVVQTIPLSEPMVYQAGQYLGARFDAANLISINTSSSEEGGGRYQLTADSDVPTTTIVSGTKLQMQFICEEDGDASASAAYSLIQRIETGSINPLVIVADGNSHYAGRDGNVPSPTVLATTLGMSIQNFGVGGQTTQQMTSDAAAQIDPVISSAIASGHTTMLILQEIYNDIRVNTLTAQQGVDNMLTYCAARKTANPTVIIGLCTLADTINATVRPLVPTVNSLLAAQAVQSGDVDFLIDLQLDAEMQDCTDTTYYQVDETHRTDLGEKIVARRHRRAIRAWLEERL